MRARISKPAFRLEFDGAPTLWNEFLRPLLGGPEAPPDPLPASATQAAATLTAVPAPVAVHGPGPSQAAPAPAPRPAVVPSAPVVRTYAPPEPSRPAATATALPSAPRTWIPPRHAAGPAPGAQSRRGPAEPGGRDDGRDDGPSSPWRRRGGPEPDIRVEPTNDPDALYERLEGMGSRRAEKDAVLAAVWFVGQDQREVHEREVEKHLVEHGGPSDVKIRPNILKHITRTKLLEPGTQPGLVRLSRKGREQIRLLCGV